MMRAINLSARRFRRKCRGSMPVSAYNAGMEVDLRAPIMSLRHWFCIRSILSSWDLFLQCIVITWLCILSGTPHNTRCRVCSTRAGLFVHHPSTFHRVFIWLVYLAAARRNIGEKTYVASSHTLPCTVYRTVRVPEYIRYWYSLWFSFRCNTRKSAMLRCFALRRVASSRSSSIRYLLSFRERTYIYSEFWSAITITWRQLHRYMFTQFKKRHNNRVQIISAYVDTLSTVKARSRAISLCYEYFYKDSFGHSRRSQSWP